MEPQGTCMNADSPALSSSVLLLNRLYMALRVISAKRAMTLIYSELAEVVSLEDGQYLSYDFDDWVAVSAHPRRASVARRGDDGAFSDAGWASGMRGVIARLRSGCKTWVFFHPQLAAGAFNRSGV